MKEVPAAAAGSTAVLAAGIPVVVETLVAEAEATSAVVGISDRGHERRATVGWKQPLLGASFTGALHIKRIEPQSSKLVRFAGERQNGNTDLR